MSMQKNENHVTITMRYLIAIRYWHRDCRGTVKSTLKFNRELTVNTLEVCTKTLASRGSTAIEPIVADLGHCLNGDIISLIHWKGFSFFRDSVRHLYLSHYLADEEAAVLSALLWRRKSLVSGPHSCHSPRAQYGLEAAAIHVKHHVGSSLIDFTHQFFSTLTPFEIFDVPSNIDLKDWSELTRLPSGYSLRVLVISHYSERHAKLLDQYGVTALAQERRFVVMVCAEYREDWIKGAHMGHDYWSQAESFTASRKSREIDPFVSYIPDADRDDDVDADSEDVE
ncbi:hypothetical protein DFH08DRAFT_814034 [Mycena albidolilacea]|uniref:Uncharacterized protein n=1 Tax=Mycena albidolilacea TaxID=1033008 RepID=A0AAD6ZPY2_9AGAR|nr:hypothetical protein DFH08DRAFT_814034 [Mycena albidolilacea]